MTNRIVDIEVTDRSTIPAEAEVHVSVWPERIEPGLEVRGRLMGPRCRFATTVEVAYHFRRVLVPTSTPAFTLRAIIPEASLWDTVSPHLYQGPVELWHAGVRIDQRTITHGLRTFLLGPKGLRINGRLTPLVGRRVETIDDRAALEMRQDGVNLLVVPADAPEAVWEVADGVGLVVLGRVGAGVTAEVLRRRAKHPSCLGWTLPDGAALTFALPPGSLMGAEGERRAAFQVRDGGATLEVNGVPFGRVG
jgi:hypothetical protein